MKTTGIINANIIQNQSVLKNHSIIFDEKIIKIEPMDRIDVANCTEVIDAQDRYVSPGFINLHIHGCASFDTMDATDEALMAMSEAQAKAGVVRFLPSTTSLTKKEIYKSLDCIRSNMGKGTGAIIQGAYLEGPFFNPKLTGPQNSANMIPPDYSFVEPYLDVIKIITIAPEIDDQFFIRRVSKQGPVMAIGHTEATYKRTMEAIRDGASLVTHCFNVMATMHHREPGALGAALMEDIMVEIIPDTITICKEMYKFILKNKGIDNIALVTDGISPTGLNKDGIYEFSGIKVIVKNGVSRNADGELAGTLLEMNKGVFNFMKYSDLTIWQAIKTASINPARVLGIDGYTGSLEIGKNADITIIDKSFDVYSTIVGGKIVFSQL